MDFEDQFDRRMNEKQNKALPTRCLTMRINAHGYVTYVHIV